jgi:hypothetical protein
MSRAQQWNHRDQGDWPVCHERCDAPCCNRIFTFYATTPRCERACVGVWCAGASRRCGASFSRESPGAGGRGRRGRASVNVGFLIVVPLGDRTCARAMMSRDPRHQVPLTGKGATTRVVTPFFCSSLGGRGERIRTSDLSVPNAALYQAEPRPDKVGAWCRRWESNPHGVAPNGF